MPFDVATWPAAAFRVVWHTLAIYAFLIVCLRYLGRRQLSQLTTIELVVVMVLGSAVETSLVAGDTSLLAGLVSASTLFLSNFLLTRALRRRRWLRHLIIGSPVLLVNNGHVLAKELAYVGLTEADLQQAVRERGYANLADVRYAVLEVDGTVGVVPKDAPTHRRGRHVNRLSD
jgi:uncharacterized membrane protein YcaP (DUF421 family)